ncbi:hypothetical protein B0H17DRAFT_1136211 [Mycena rosella]|uniref:Uncharacterized protein n=1 Tax=Mycena rosella TaxID=1033263 RepID=A0AAD7GGV3_MYCRO|nr:hypothetical protein B0H17DRAFT_1136211 [Mycena rosella]
MTPRVPNTRSCGASASAPSAPALPSNATPAEVAMKGYPEKEKAAKGKNIDLPLSSPAQAGSNVKDKAREYDVRQPTARSDASFNNSFGPLAELEEHRSLDEEITADFLGLPVAGRGGSGGDISSTELSDNNLSAPSTSMPAHADVMKEFARRLAAHDNATRAAASKAFSTTESSASAPPSPTKAPSNDTLSSPFLKPVPTTDASTPPAGSSSPESAPGASFAAVDTPATNERTTTTSARTNATPSAGNTTGMPAVALRNPKLKVSPPVALETLLANIVSSPTASATIPPLATATTAPTGVPQDASDPNGSCSAAASEFDAAFAATRMDPTLPAAHAQMNHAAALFLAAVGPTTSTMPGPKQFGGLPVTTPSIAAGATLRSAQPSGLSAPSAPSSSTTTPRTAAQPTLPHVAQAAAPHVTQATAPQAAQPTAPHATQSAAPHIAQPIAPHPVAQPTPLPGAQPAPLLIAQPGVPPPAQPNAGYANTVNPAPGAAPAAIAHAGILAPIFVPVGTAAIAAPVGNAAALSTPLPPGGFRVFGWDTESVKEGIDGSHLTKWDVPGTPKALTIVPEMEKVFRQTSG